MKKSNTKSWLYMKSKGTEWNQLKAWGQKEESVAGEGSSKEWLCLVAAPEPCTHRQEHEQHHTDPAACMHPGRAELAAPLGEGPGAEVFEPLPCWPETHPQLGDTLWTRGDSAPQGHVVGSEGIFYCQNWGGTTGIQWVKTKHPAKHRTNPATRNCPAQNPEHWGCEILLSREAWGREGRELPASEGARQEQEEEKGSSEECSPQFPRGLRLGKHRAEVQQNDSWTVSIKMFVWSRKQVKRSD